MYPSTPGADIASINGNQNQTKNNTNSYNTNSFNTSTTHHHYSQSVPGEGLRELANRVAFDAFHDSEQRYPQPKCHPDTRKSIIDIASSFIEGKTSSTVLWIYGTVGVGKSAIAQTLCDKYAQTDLAASFFFSRNDPSRNCIAHFVPSIAYQLADSDEALGQLVNRTIQRHPRVLNADVETQFRKLILEPCAQLPLPSNVPPVPRRIIIDGLDECVDISSQERLIRLIRNACVSTPPLPFYFLICSRPEPRIRNAFHQETGFGYVALTHLGPYSYVYNIFKSRLNMESPYTFL